MAATIFDIDFQKDRSDSVLKVLVYANLNSPDDVQFIGHLLLNGNTIQTCESNIILDNTSSQGKIPLSPAAYITDIGIGTHNVKFVMVNTETDNVALVVKKGATIEITELKQGAL